MSAALQNLPAVLQRTLNSSACTGPAAPCVYATATLSGATQTFTGAASNLAAYTETVDLGGSFSNGAFTAPFAGVYSVTFGGMLHGVGSQGGLLLQKTATVGSNTTVTTAANLLVKDSTSNVLSRSCLVPLAAADSLRLAGSNVVAQSNSPPYIQIRAAAYTV